MRVSNGVITVVGGVIGVCGLVNLFCASLVRVKVFE